MEQLKQQQLIEMLSKLTEPSNLQTLVVNFEKEKGYNGVVELDSGIKQEVKGKSIFDFLVSLTEAVNVEYKTKKIWNG